MIIIAVLFVTRACYRTLFIIFLHIFNGIAYMNYSILFRGTQFDKCRYTFRDKYEIYYSSAKVSSKSAPARKHLCYLVQRYREDNWDSEKETCSAAYNILFVATCSNLPRRTCVINVITVSHISLGLLTVIAFSEFYVVSIIPNITRRS